MACFFISLEKTDRRPNVCFFFALLGDGRIISSLLRGASVFRTVPIYRDTAIGVNACRQRASLSDKMRQHRTNRGGGRASVVVDQIISKKQLQKQPYKMERNSDTLNKK